MTTLTEHYTSQWLSEQALFKLRGELTDEIMAASQVLHKLKAKRQQIHRQLLSLQRERILAEQATIKAAKAKPITSAWEAAGLTPEQITKGLELLKEGQTP